MKSFFVCLVLLGFAVLLSGCGSGGGNAPPAPAAFAVSAGPASPALVPGGSVSVEVTVQPVNGFSGPVEVTLSNLPAGVTATPSTFQLIISGQNMGQAVTLTAGFGAALGSTTVVINAASGALSSSFQLTLRIQPTSVTTWHYDNGRTGVNPYEAVLTASNVNVNTFGKMFTLPADGAITGQVLYLPNVAIPGNGVHNVIYAATMHDSVYAFDADSNGGGTPLWQITLLPPGATSVPMTVQGCAGITAWTEVGVVSTPVIDEATGTLYVVAKSYESGATVFRLHALDVTSGAEKFGGPAEINASFTLNGNTDTFNNLAEINRPALLLANGHIYLAFGSNGCNDFGDQGWVLSYNASTLALEGTFNTEPGQALASIWQKGGGLSADSGGNIYGESAEGDFVAGTNFGTTVLKFSQFGTNLTLADWFTPFNQDYLRVNDLDLNDPVLILPDQPGAYPHLALAVGKVGTLYLLNRDNMGQFCSNCTNTDTQIVQELPSAVGKETGALVYWNSTVYSSAVNSPIMAWSLANGLLPARPAVQSESVAGMHSPVLTASGSTNGILWQINGQNLSAYDAVSLVRLYASDNANGRDDLPPLPHFAHFMVVNGKLYVGTNNSIVVYGLL